jgi:hypothetical protein
MPQHIAFADAGFVAEPQTRAETVHFVRLDAARSFSDAEEAEDGSRTS